MIVRNFKRNDLAKLFGELGFTKGAEIGVKMGRFSEVLCKEIKGLNHICVDPWAEYVSYDGHLRKKQRCEFFYQDCLNRLKDFNVRYIRKPSVDAAEDVENESLDFVYIDANHEYKNVIDDINVWGKKVRVGGVISGHDYDEKRFCEVFRAVNDYVRKEKVDLFVTEENIPSWFFCKRKGKG